MDIKSKSTIQICAFAMSIVIIVGFIWLLPKNAVDALYRGNGGATSINVDGGRVGEYLGEYWDDPVFYIEDINGVKYDIDDANAFVVNNNYETTPTTPIYVTADKSASVPRAEVKSVVIRNITFNLRSVFFSFAFNHCSKLTLAVLDNITVNRNGVTNVSMYFYNAFSHSALTAAPAIPALPGGVTSVTNYLWAVFNSCISLTSSPGIPALPDSVTSANYCYNGMFYNCSSLTFAPTIPALPGSVTSAIYYLSNTFENCTSLTSVAAIPALPGGVTTANYYLYDTFNGCSSLTVPPEIPALPGSVTNANNYLYYTFYGCTSLIAAPVIPALPNGVTNAVSYLYATFYNCPQLTNELIPNIPPFTGPNITSLPTDCTVNYAGGPCPATPDTPITTLEQFRAGYNYH